jgi:hypothetical protein
MTRQAAFDDDPFDGFEDDAPVRLAPAGRVRARRLPWLRMSLMSGVAVFGLVILAQEQQAVDPEPETGFVPQAVLVAPPPAWQTIPQPSALYALVGTEGALPHALAARRHSTGGREDRLQFGSPGEPGYGLVSLVRGIREGQAGSFYVDMVRRAAEAGLSVARSGQAARLDTKFGPVETAPLVLAGAAEQACLAFRFSDGELAFGFAGWLCGSEGRGVQADQLACFLDRLALAKGGDDPALRILFAQADERRSQACAPVARLPAQKVKAAAARS